MAATVSSAWSKPGAWALDSEQHEDELQHQQQPLDPTRNLPDPPVSDFPSLSASLSSKPTKKKNKPQTFSLSQFSNYTSTPKPGSGEPARLTPDEIRSLPTGPRERTAEELERNKLGGGFRNYGDNANSRVRVSKDMGPSRADEVDDWSKTKKFGSGYERRDKGGFFNSSRADEVDDWASGKKFGFDSGRRERRVGFESYTNGLGPDSDNWVRRKDERGVESDTWGRRREESGNERPKLNLQPRTLPVVVSSNNNGGHVQGSSPVEGGKGKVGNPFGEARPREEVLKEKGKDWKEIDEKLDALKVKDVNGGEGFGKRRGFGIGRSDSSTAVESAKTWKKPVSNDVVASDTTASAEEGHESVEAEVNGKTSKGDNVSGEN